MSAPNLAQLSAALLPLAKFVDDCGGYPLEAVCISLPGDVFDPIYQQAIGMEAEYDPGGRSKDSLIIDGCCVNGWRSPDAGN